MFGKRITLFKMFGFAVRVDMSWIIIAVLVTWSLAEGVFKMQYAQFSQGQRWLMGLAGAFGLFASIVFHELCHSLVARRFDLHMKGITLFVFGGVAEMSEEPASPKAEFSMAIAGPAASALVGAACLAVAYLGDAAGWPIGAVGVVRWLGIINIVLVAFNMIPGFPLDGGRILRSILWAWKHNLRWATYVSSRVGNGFGLLLIGLGVLSVIYGNFIGGMWWFLIGMFIRFAAKQGYEQVLIRQSLQGEPVRRFMTANPIAVPTEPTLQQLAEDYIYRYHHKMFPVVDHDGRLIGCAGVNQLRNIPRQQWSQHTVGQVLQACDGNTISADADATEALAMMSRGQTSRLMVLEGDRLVGVLSLADLLKFLSLKMELESGTTQKAAA